MAQTMILEDFYFISQIVAAVGIMASLVFVGLQMRAQNRETRLASMSEVMAEYRQSMANLASDRELVETLMKCDEVGLTRLNQVDFLRLALVCISFLRVFEQAYIYRYEGRIDDRTWASMNGMMSTTFHYRGCLDYFELRKSTFTQVFVEYVELEFADLLEERRASGVLLASASEEGAA